MIRPATAADLPFLERMLIEAADWDGTRAATAETVRADPHAWLYLDGWPRATDFGVVAVEGDTLLGATWARFLSGAADGYGYVGDAIPELTLAVAPGARHRGVGTELLAGLVTVARDLGLSGLSLSVEDGNAAARPLYERAGFVVVGRNGDSDTMLLRIQE